MIIFMKDSKRILKYRVTTDLPKLLELMQEIKDTCSKVTHITGTSDYLPRKPVKGEMRNFHKTEVGEKEYFEETRTLYQFEYDLYEDSYLVELIEKLINTDTCNSTLIELYTVSSEASIESQLDEIDEKLRINAEELQNGNPFDTKARAKNLNEIKRLLNQKNKTQEKTLEEGYIDRIKDLLVFTFLDEMDEKSISKINDFFEKNISDEVPLIDKNLFFPEKGQVRVRK